MSVSDSHIPTGFSSDVLAALEDFDRRIYFQWDLTLDIITLKKPLPNTFYDLSHEAGRTSSQLWLDGFIHPDDVVLLHTYLRIIYSASARFHNRRCKLACKLRLRARNKKDYIWSEIHIITYFKGFAPVMAFGNIRNVQAQKLQQMRFERQAQRDKLTGLLNKETTQARITRYLSGLSPELDREALLLVDADGFKDINDAFGHLFGDAVIQDMGNTISHTFRHTDIIGRIGGDEFVVLFRSVHNVDILRERCAQLIENMRRTYRSDGRELPLSVSIGVAIYPDHGESYTDLFKHADRALYEAKSLGKSRYIFYKSSLLGSASVTNHRSPEDFAALQQKAFRDNMIEFIFMVLYETKSPSATITHSLSMFGMQYNLDRVAIDRYDEITSRYQTAYEWLSPSGVTLQVEEPTKDEADTINLRNEMVLSRYQPTPYGVMSVCGDTAELDERYQSAARALNVRAFAHCLITHGNDTLGCIGFEAARPIDITEEMRRSLSVFAVILGNILLSNQSAKKTATQNKQLRTLLDHFQEMVYVVDKITMQPVYFNQTIRQAIPIASTTMTCYQLFHQRVTPCLGCPVKRLSGEGSEYIECELDNWGCGPTPSRACNLQGEDLKQPLALVVQETTHN